MTPPCYCAYNRTMDLKTPRNVKLTAFYKRSFAFKTVKDRLPVLLTKLIDILSQNKNKIAEEYNNKAKDDLKVIISKLSKLKYEIQTNKPLLPIKSGAADALIYNEYIAEQDGSEGPPSPFHSIWLLVETYMYRKIWEAFEKSTQLKDFDPFKFFKEEEYTNALPQIRDIAAFSYEALNRKMNEEDFSNLLRLNLWGNKYDLSLATGGLKSTNINQIRELDSSILVNDSGKTWDALSSKTTANTVDFILDNAGLELFTDFCLADYLISNELVKTVNFHVKMIPWYMSDTLATDIKWLLEQLSKNFDDLNLSNLGDRWSKHFENKSWIIKYSDFWTLPVDFEYMQRYDRNLYKELSQSKLLFIKGDLNYRKLFRETNWDPTTPVSKAQGSFGPTKLCAIRTLKADMICGLPPGLAEKIEENNSQWMVSAQYAVIQFSDKIVPLLDQKDLISLGIDSGVRKTANYDSCLCRHN